MTPLEAALIAQAVYSAPPVVGVPASAGRATVYGAAQDALAIPGSDNIACWLADLDALAVTVPGFGRIHQGFWTAWLEIRDAVLDLQGLTTMIGHSEGGALALLCAANLCLISRPPKAVWAFEPPRITTDDALAKLFAAHGVELHLYRNGLDVVPIVPRLLESWQHPAPLIEIGMPCLPFPNVQDHLIQNVVASLSVQASAPYVDQALLGD